MIYGEKEITTGTILISEREGIGTECFEADSHFDVRIGDGHKLLPIRGEVRALGLFVGHFETHGRRCGREKSGRWMG